ncbi:hypothetical protein VMT65_08255 [Nocardia sp. CDC153]|uniref:hypothetical protein n=1 Tax=Nocardia sp. CDC153 TaxID=3112167 RepID=UPI002DB6A301|nr:hypothetical protein [Nocardia sp. CDC153]MEC3953018.1 hypothetical protein [Nocardia sp. CDC153]
MNGAGSSAQQSRATPSEPTRSRRAWAWIAGAAVLTALVAIAAILVTHGKSSVAAEGPTYHDPADECALISAATVTKLTPGAPCKRSPNNPFNPDEIVHTPSWAVESFTRPTSIQVTLRLTSTASKSYAHAKSSLAESYTTQLTAPTVAAVAPADIGVRVRDAFLISGASRAIPGRSEARLVFWSGNMVADITFADWANVGDIEATVKAVGAELFANLR